MAKTIQLSGQCSSNVCVEDLQHVSFSFLQLQVLSLLYYFGPFFQVLQFSAIQSDSKELMPVEGNNQSLFTCFLSIYESNSICSNSVFKRVWHKRPLATLYASSKAEN